MALPALIAAVALAALVLGGKKKSRGTTGQLTLDAAMRACIEAAAPKVGDRIVWATDGEKQGWVVQLTAAGFTKAAQCVGFEGVDLAVCMPMLNDAIAADLRAMAQPLTGAAAFSAMAAGLADNGFPEAAACFQG